MAKKNKWIKENKNLIIVLLLIGFVYYAFSSGLIDFSTQSITNNTYNTTNNPVTPPESNPVEVVPDEVPADEPNFDWFVFIPFNNPCDDYATKIGFPWVYNPFNAAGGNTAECGVSRGTSCSANPPKGFTGNIDNLFCCSFDKQCYEQWELA